MVSYSFVYISFFNALTSMFNSCYNWTKIVITNLPTSQYPPHIFFNNPLHFDVCHNTEEKIWRYFCFIVTLTAAEKLPHSISSIKVCFCISVQIWNPITAVYQTRQNDVQNYEWLMDFCSVILIKPTLLPDDNWHLSGLIITIEEL